MTEITYKDSGVDTSKSNQLVESIKEISNNTENEYATPDIGGFAGFFEIKNFKDPVMVASTDGVGSKLKLAIDCNMLDFIGIDLVAMCVNDILAVNAKPIVFLDYMACNKLDLKKSIKIIKGIERGCKQAGCALIGGETAEVPMIYNNNDYDLAGFAVGVIERSIKDIKITPREGDRIYGITSSGLHSNGYSLIWKLIKNGNIKLTDDLIEKLLIPTKIYTNEVEYVTERFVTSGMAHITGGGLEHNIKRVIPDNLGFDIDISRVNCFDYFYDLLSPFVSDGEMLKTFNCGIGYIFIIPRGQMFERLTDKEVFLGEITSRETNIKWRA